MRYSKTLILAGLFTSALVACIGAEKFEPEPVVASVERSWHGTDYEQFAELVSSGKARLPLLTRSEDVALFARLTSEQNFGLAQNSQLPIEVRLQDIVQIQGAWNRIFVKYIEVANRGAKVSRELTRGLVFTLKIFEVEFELVDEFLPILPKDEAYEKRKEGLTMMISGLVSTFVGAEQSLSESIYSSDDKSEIVAGIAETLPQLCGKFSPSIKKELEQKFRNRLRTAKKPADISNLEKIVASLKA